MSIQGQTLEVRVVGCNRLKDTKWIKRQNPYVSIEYGSSKFLSSICTDGGINPTFQEKIRITLVEGLRELNVGVWNSNTVSYDHLIGNGRVQLEKVLSEGFDDTAWPILSKTSRYAGEVCLVIHYSNANNPQPQPQYAAPPPPQPQYYAAPPQPQPQYYAAPPPPQYCAAPPQVPICCAPPPPPQYCAAPPQVPICCAPPPPPPAAAPPQPSMYPPQYPPQAYAPQSYPPQPYPPPGYPPSPSHAYPPQN